MLSVNRNTEFEDIFFNDKRVDVVLWNGVIVWKRIARLIVSPTKIVIPASGVTDLRLNISANIDWKIE